MRVKHVRNEQRLIIPQRARNMKNINATERSSFHKTFHKKNHHDEKYNFKHKVIFISFTGLYDKNHKII